MNDRSNTIYPLLQQIGQESTSVFSATNLSMLNNAYRRRSASYRNFSQGNNTNTPAYKTLTDFQKILQNAANPYQNDYNQQIFKLQKSEENTNDLLSRLSKNLPTNTPFTGSGSRYVVARIEIANTPSQSESQRRREGPNTKNRQYVLHYYQSNTEEIVLLQDTSNQQFGQGLLQTQSSVGKQLEHIQSRLGLGSPAISKSDRFGTNFGSSTGENLIATRKVGDDSFRLASTTKTDIGGGTQNDRIKQRLADHLERFKHTSRLQNQIDEASLIGKSLSFNVTQPRSLRNAEYQKKSLNQLGNFFPNFNQGFTLSSGDSQNIEKGNLINFYRDQKFQSQKFPSRYQQVYDKAGINPSLYQNYDILKKSQTLGEMMANPLDMNNSRQNYLLAQQPLQFANFKNIISDKTGGLGSHINGFASASARTLFADDFQNEDSLFIGTVRLVDNTSTYESYTDKYGPTSLEEKGFSTLNNGQDRTLETLLQNFYNLDPKKLNLQSPSLDQQLRLVNIFAGLGKIAPFSFSAGPSPLENNYQISRAQGASGILNVLSLDFNGAAPSTAGV